MNKIYKRDLSLVVKYKTFNLRFAGSNPADLINYGLAYFILNYKDTWATKNTGIIYFYKKSKWEK
jgi:hypothetical protein